MDTYDTDKKSENEQIIAEVKTEAPATMFTAWKKYACFEGRASRREYWLFQISIAIVTYPLSFLLNFVPEIFKAALSIALLLFCGAGILPLLGVTIRRLHDTGRNWLYLLNYVAISIVAMSLCYKGAMSVMSGDIGIYFIIAGGVLSLCGLISFIITMSRASELCENRYGANPNQGNHDGIAPAIFGILILFILPLLIRGAEYAYTSSTYYNVEQVKRVIKTNHNAYQEENVEGVLATMQGGPIKNFDRAMLTAFFEKYDLAYELINLNVISCDKVDAVIEVKEKVTKISGPSFRNHTRVVEHTLMKGVGGWRIIKSEIKSVEYL